MKRMLAASLMALAGLSTAGHPPAEMHAVTEAPSHYGTSFERFASEMNTSMAKTTHDMHAPGFSGDPDIDFLTMMIPHHEGALDMTRLILEHGNDPITRSLAADMLANQRVEIESMQRRLNALKRGASRSNPDGYPALGGTRKGQD